jgi:hypothetical protein
MIRLFKSLSLLLFLLLSSCAHYQVADFKIHATLPASKDGFGVSVLSRRTERIPAEDWEKMKLRGLIILPEEYAKLKKSIIKNCQVSQCEQITGALDDLFLTIDDAVRIIERMP